MTVAAILDVDGTLVDTNYHHALAWYRAFLQNDVHVPLWRIHRAQGMGGDKLVAHVAGAEVEERLGDAVRAAEEPLYRELMDEVRPMPGAAGLIDALREREVPIVLASSGKEHEVDHYLDLLGVRDVVAGWTTSADVEETKPEPDLVAAALDKVDAGSAVMVGDSPYDCEAAKRCGLRTLAVLTGGFSPEELASAGAAEVYESLEDLARDLDRSPLGR